MNRIEIKQMAKEQIKGKIGTLFVIALIASVISSLGSMVLSLVPFVGSIASLVLISSPIALGIYIVYLKVASGKDIEIQTVFEGYSDMWGAFKVNFLVALFTLLWSLLFFIPGLIKSISYSMSFYILAENPGMPALEAIEKSKIMMHGHKMEFFVLGLSFIGWLILVGLTFGIAGIWVIPYMSTTQANFYNKIKGTPEVIYATAEETPEAE